MNEFYRLMRFAVYIIIMLSLSAMNVHFFGDSTHWCIIVLEAMWLFLSGMAIESRFDKYM